MMIIKCKCGKAICVHYINGMIINILKCPYCGNDLMKEKEMEESPNGMAVEKW